MKSFWYNACLLFLIFATAGLYGQTTGQITDTVIDNTGVVEHGATRAAPKQVYTDWDLGGGVGASFFFSEAAVVDRLFCSALIRLEDKR